MDISLLLPSSLVKFLTCSARWSWKSRGRHYRGQTGSVQLRGSEARNSTHAHRSTCKDFARIKERGTSNCTPKSRPFLFFSTLLLFLHPGRNTNLFLPFSILLLFRFHPPQKRPLVYLYRISVAYPRSPSADKTHSRTAPFHARNKIYNKYEYIS